MNKQLIELGIQAGLMTGEKEQLFFCRPIAQFDEYSSELEKFAELIVLECARVVKASSPNGMIGVNAIRIHFGVEP